MSEETKKNFELLWQEANNNRHSSVFSLASQMLSTNPNDSDLQKTQSVALINLGRFEEAASSPFDYEKAYSLYKLQRYQETLAIVQRPEKSFTLLRAQTVSSNQFFKSNQNQLAAAEYEELIKNEPENLDLKINLSGSLLVPGLYESVLSHPLLVSENWEILFNKSCALAELHRYSEALSTLRGLERKLTEDKELESELWLVKGQIGYVLQGMQEKTKAAEIYEEILKSKAESNVKAVAKNNLVALKELDSKQGVKLLKEALDQDNKLINSQKIGVLENIGLLCHKKRKINEANEYIKAAEELDPSSERLGFIKTFFWHKEKKHEEYKKYLMNKNATWAYGLLIKLLLEQNKLKDAEEVFDAMTKGKNINFSAEDCSDITRLLDKAGMTQKAVEMLEEGCKSFKDKTLLVKYGNLLRKIGQNEKAVSIFENYLAGSQDMLVTANLVLAAAESKTELARTWAAKLPKINLKALYNSANSVESLDEIIDKLEFANLQGRVKEEKIITEIKKKRKRKPKYPKNFDPSNPNNPKPDPERWLAKKDRKEFKKKGRKKAQKMKGPQGVVSAEAQGQEVGGFTKGPSTAHTQAVGEGKKKNKKRR